MPQEECADMCGLDRTYIAGIERGERRVDFVELQYFAKIYKKPFSFFQTI